MRIFALLLFLAAGPAQAHAHAKQRLLQAQIRRDTFTIEHDEQSYRLVFQRKRGATKSVTLTEAQAKNLASEATRIVWEAAYRSPASKTCHKYARLSTPSDQVDICNENAQAVGASYGLLNSLRKHF